MELSMKAMIPDGHGCVLLSEVAEPVSAANEAVIAVDAYSINRGETFLLERPLAGWRPGKDVAGTVVSAATDGSGPQVGARVVGHPSGSGWAQRVAVSTASLADLPDDVGAIVAAALPLAGLTAMRLLRLAGSMIGQRLLITGASGGVGHYLVELAAAAGAEVTAVTATTQRGTRLRELGARTVTDVADARGWFDIAMESVGGGSLGAVRRRVRPDGQVIWFGQASRTPVNLDFFDWVDGTAGAPITQFHYARSDKTDGEDLATLVRLVHEDRLHPEIGAVGPWELTPDVIDDLRSRRVRGNAVLEVKA
jgi:NADPH:quinone reductase-like Zn-dependent oxidoreductase